MTFATTRWSVVLSAGGEGEDHGRLALEELCRIYWYPLYSYARHRGLDPDTAADRTQGFFVHLLEKPFLASADPGLGRFRAYLLTGFKRFLSHERDRERTLKRGGDRQHFSLDFDEGERRFREEPVDERTPESAFERRWALTILEQALTALTAEYEAAGKATHFAALRPLLIATGNASIADAAAALDMTESATRVALFRLRGRYRERLRAEVAETVAAEGDVDEELRELQVALTT